jgi:hypothetical protein
VPILSRILSYESLYSILLIEDYSRYHFSCNMIGILINSSLAVILLLVPDINTRLCNNPPYFYAGQSHPRE